MYSRKPILLAFVFVFSLAFSGGCREIGSAVSPTGPTAETTSGTDSSGVNSTGNSSDIAQNSPGSSSSLGSGGSANSGTAGVVGNGEGYGGEGLGGPRNRNPAFRCTNGTVRYSLYIPGSGQSGRLLDHCEMKSQMVQIEGSLAPVFFVVDSPAIYERVELILLYPGFAVAACDGTGLAIVIENNSSARTGLFYQDPTGQQVKPSSHVNFSLVNADPNREYIDPTGTIALSISTPQTVPIEGGQYSGLLTMDGQVYKVICRVTQAN